MSRRKKMQLYNNFKSKKRIREFPTPPQTKQTKNGLICLCLKNKKGGNQLTNVKYLVLRLSSQNTKYVTTTLPHYSFEL